MSDYVALLDTLACVESLWLGHEELVAYVPRHPGQSRKVRAERCRQVREAFEGQGWRVECTEIPDGEELWRRGATTLSVWQELAFLLRRFVWTNRAFATESVVAAYRACYAVDPARTRSIWYRWVPDWIDRPAPGPRECLRCGVSFDPPNALIRLCASCRIAIRAADRVQ